MFFFSLQTWSFAATVCALNPFQASDYRSTIFYIIGWHFIATVRREISIIQIINIVLFLYYPLYGLWFRITNNSSLFCLMRMAPLSHHTFYFNLAQSSSRNAKFGIRDKRFSKQHSLLYALLNNAVYDEERSKTKHRAISLTSLYSTHCLTLRLTKKRQRKKPLCLYSGLSLLKALSTNAIN